MQRHLSHVTCTLLLVTSIFSAQASAEVASNLLVNPGFEFASAGWTEFGSNGAPVDNINYEPGSGGPHQGSLALKLFEGLSGQPNEAGVYQDIAVLPNTLYEYRGYLRNGEGQADYLQGSNAGFLKIVWLDNTLSDISTIENNVPPQGISSATPHDNAWLFNQLHVESPASAAIARVMAVHAHASSSFEGGSSWFDSLQFGVAVPEPGTMFIASLAFICTALLYRHKTVKANS